MMWFYPENLEKHYQKNRRRYAFSEELSGKMQRLQECFTGNILPPPSAKLTAAWEDMPNATTNIMPVSMKTGLVFLSAPPPTPTRIAFELRDATSRGSSSSDNSRVVAENVTTTSSKTVAYPSQESASMCDDSMSLCDSDQPSEKQKIEEDNQSTEGNSPSSSSAPSSGDQTSWTPVGFSNTVHQWFLEYQARGTDAFVKAMIAYGVVSFGAAPLASHVAREVIRKVCKMSYTEGKSLENALRFSALASFKDCWGSSNDPTTLPTLAQGAGIASFIGSLYDEKISTARDVFLCLSHLMGGEKIFERLCAIRAMLAHANDKLCKSRNFSALMEFKYQISAKDEESGEYLWAANDEDSKAVLTDILATIGEWTASQAVRREESRRTTEKCTVRTRAVGPRLRGSSIGMEPPVAL